MSNRPDRIQSYVYLMSQTLHQMEEGHSSQELILCSHDTLNDVKSDEPVFEAFSSPKIAIERILSRDLEQRERAFSSAERGK